MEAVCLLQEVFINKIRLYLLSDCSSAAAAAHTQATAHSDVFRHLNSSWLLVWLGAFIMFRQTRSPLSVCVRHAKPSCHWTFLTRGPQCRFVRLRHHNSLVRFRKKIYIFTLQVSLLISHRLQTLIFWEKVLCVTYNFTPTSTSLEALPLCLTSDGGSCFEI